VLLAITALEIMTPEQRQAWLATLHPDLAPDSLPRHSLADEIAILRAESERLRALVESTILLVKTSAAAAEM
jgi:hypothetical protein